MRAHQESKALVHCYLQFLWGIQKNDFFGGVSKDLFRWETDESTVDHFRIGEYIQKVNKGYELGTPGQEENVNLVDEEWVYCWEI